MDARVKDEQTRVVYFGFSNGSKAVLEISGEAPGGKLVGEAFLVKEGDNWRVDDEITDLMP